MVYKIHNRTASQIGHIRWSPAMHSSSIFLRANAFYNGRGIGSGIPLHEFRKRVEGSPEYVYVTHHDNLILHGFKCTRVYPQRPQLLLDPKQRAFAGHDRMQILSPLRDLTTNRVQCWCRKPDNSVQCAAFYEEKGGVLTIHPAGQYQGDVIDEIPVSCVVNLYMRDLKSW
ncbi:hypothetical protein PIIN_01105 [Serendipita indica DSM 11827]|uniref:Uncharacterized protein n=1 Tax=Serendipita indica (strain DSM 11827) TaxID=1109443 RepID=G4T7E8_SERID|nr:hypothetical protein PIIN_01105 [Serendipita indica DSM 11827]